MILKKGNLKIRNKGVVTGILFTLFLYQDAFTYNVSNMFSYFDELEALAVVEMLLVYYIRRAFVIPLKNRKIIMAYLGFLICGILGNLKSNFQTLGYIMLDIVTCSKLFINFIFFQVVFRNKIGNNTERIVYEISKISIWILFILVIHEYIFPPFFPYLEDRYNIHSLRLFFSNQTYLAETGIYLLLIVTIIGDSKIKNLILKMMAICIVASTMRTKALGFLAVYMMLQIIPVIRNKRKIFICLCLAGVLCVLVGHEYIYYYFFGKSSKLAPRKILLMDSIDIAKKYFPVGSGFGTFCSGAANLSNSKMYAEYNYNQDYPFNDMFWACIFGQVGFLGCVFFFKFVYEIVICIINCRGALKRSYYGTLLYIIYLLIATLGECSFFAPYSNLFGMTIGYLIATRKYEEMEKMVEIACHGKIPRGGVKLCVIRERCVNVLYAGYAV